MAMPAVMSRRRGEEEATLEERIEEQVRRRTRVTVARDAVDLDDVALTVDAGDLALVLGLGEVATHDLDLIILADGDRLHLVLEAELLGEGSAHQDAALVRGRSEDSLAVLLAVRGNSL